MVIKLGNVVFEKDAGCETCGDLEPFTATIKEGIGIPFCMGCALTENMDLGATKEEIFQMEKEAKLKYFEKRIKDLKK